MDFPTSSNLLDLNMNILHLIVTYIILPRWGNYTKITLINAFVMFIIIHHHNINLSNLMLSHMTYVTNLKSITLPNGKSFTMIFLYFRIDFFGKDSYGLQNVHAFRRSYLGHMHYCWDDNCEPYHHMIRSYKIYLYSIEALAEHLPPNYATPVRTPPKVV